MVKDDEAKELKQQVPYLYLGTSALVHCPLASGAAAGYNALTGDRRRQITITDSLASPGYFSPVTTTWCLS